MGTGETKASQYFVVVRDRVFVAPGGILQEIDYYYEFRFQLPLSLWIQQLSHTITVEMSRVRGVLENQDVHLTVGS